VSITALGKTVSREGEVANE